MPYTTHLGVVNIAPTYKNDGVGMVYFCFTRIMLSIYCDT